MIPWEKMMPSIESDIELDDTDLVDPDNDPPQKVNGRILVVAYGCRLLKYDYISFFASMIISLNFLAGTAVKNMSITYHK